MTRAHLQFAARECERGDTLIEILITIVVMGLTVTALIGALTLGVSSTDSHRRLTSVEVVSRQYGELVVDQATHPVAKQLALAAASGDGTVCVTSSTGFPGSGSFTAAIDSEVVTVSSINNSPSGTCTTSLWTLAANLNADHPQGSSVTKYQSCPTASDLFVSGFTPSPDARVTAPTVANILSVDYFDRTGNSVASSNCANYWSATGVPCSGFDSSDTEHLTGCDVPVIRVTLKLDSTDVGTPTGASATTRVFIRRGNA